MEAPRGHRVARRRRRAHRVGRCGARRARGADPRDRRARGVRPRVRVERDARCHGPDAGGAGDAGDRGARPAAGRWGGSPSPTAFRPARRPASGSAAWRSGSAAKTCGCRSAAMARWCTARRSPARPPERPLRAAGATIFVTTQRCLPIWRSREKPCCSNIDSAPLWRNDEDTDRPRRPRGSSPRCRRRAARSRRARPPAPSRRRHAPLAAVDEEAGDPPVGQRVSSCSYARRCLIRGSSSVGPNWHQPTQASPSKTSAACARPSRTRASFSARFCATVLWRPTPSAWKPMHQQPPQTPLCRSTRSAKSGHVDSSSGLTVRSVIGGYTDLRRSRRRTASSGDRRPLRMTARSHVAE